jgi:hypothetical protein
MPHPWHDVPIGDEAPEEFTALIWRIRSRASLFGGARCCGYPIAHAKATAVCSDPEERIIQFLVSELRRIPLPRTPVNRVVSPPG